MDTKQVLSEITDAGKKLAMATPEQRQLAFTMVSTVARNILEFPTVFARLNQVYQDLSPERMAEVDAIVSKPMNSDDAFQVIGLLVDGQ